MLIRGFIYSDITNNIRFTEPCSCNGHECFSEQYAFLTKKEDLSKAQSEVILYETKTYFQNDSKKLVKTGPVIQRRFISNISEYLDKYHYNSSDDVKKDKFITS